MYIRSQQLLATSLIAIFATTFASGGQNNFADLVRKTEPLTPDQEKASFHLPPGFEIQLVASEPDINKPINMQFDERGRLWVTSTIEYPFPVKLDQKGRDQIKILENFDENGHARKVTTFTTGLNIPVGIYPWRGGAIAHSIPNIWRFEDTDGDGKADKQDLLIGRIGFEKDTHGMTSAFRRGFDGWLYACHGFNNTSTITASDGSSITINSGNTYRFAIDGSHVEQYTWGQVNPFGLAFDALGNLYSADCHSMPIYHLLRGAYYPSFGKPDNGLGFGPQMMKHSHGSTAIGGITLFYDDTFPAEFRENIIVGNVMTSRVNRDQLVDTGSTRTAKELPDFVSTEDPWFRPVDLQLGPDGAIYVADFYNRIIGHYEVPLTHPGRDRESGRIWRIVYKGNGVAERRPPDISKSSCEELIANLAQKNLTLRMLSMHQLVDRVGNASVEPLKTLLRGNATAEQKMHGLWVLQRLKALDADLVSALAKDADRGVRTHLMRALSETPAWQPGQRELVVAALSDADAFVQRNASDALGRHPDVENIRPLIALRQRVNPEDTHLLYTVRMALRQQFVPEGNLSKLPFDELSAADRQSIADVVVAVPSAEAAAFLVKHLQNGGENAENTSRYLKHAARYVPEKEMDGLAAFAQKQMAGNTDGQFALLKSLQEGVGQRGLQLTPEFKKWAVELTSKMLVPPEVETPGAEWTSLTLNGDGGAPAWAVQARQSSDGDKNGSFFSSLPNGERYTGILRSKTFTLPPKLSFYVAGHNGPPPAQHTPKNFIRLREANTNAQLMESLPPRNDIAQAIHWDLQAHVGKSGYIEIVDGDTADAYAWLAVGRFNPPVVIVPTAPKSDSDEKQMQSIIDVIRVLKLNDVEPQLSRVLSLKKASPAIRAASGKALIELNAANALAVANIVSDSNESAAVREKVAEALGGVDSADARKALTEALRQAPDKLQPKFALALASTSAGAEALLQGASEGKVSARVLLERAVKERLSSSKIPDVDARIEKLTKGIKPLDQELQKLIDQRRTAFNPAKASADAGAKVFEKTCMVCHQMDGKGALIGPQLDGVGARGLDRLVEDVLDPNRNVDGAFRYSILKLANGQVVNGLQRREEGETLIFADSTGKEFTVPKKDILDRKESQFSLMPDNFSEAIPVDDFNNLMAYLLSKTIKR